MKTQRRTKAHQAWVEQVRRSNAAQPYKNKKKYDRKNKDWKKDA